MKEDKVFWKRFALCVFAFAVLAVLTYLVAGNDWKTEQVETGSVSRSVMLYTDQPVLQVDQTVQSPVDEIHEVRLDVDVQNPEKAVIELMLTAGNGETGHGSGTVQALEGSGFVSIRLDEPVRHVRGEEVTLHVRAEGVVLWSGSTVSNGRFDIPVPTEGTLVHMGNEIPGTLAFALGGINHLSAYRVYWPAVICGGAVLAGLAIYVHVCMRRGKENMLTVVLAMVRKYRFLLKTLVKRDFKIKYKGSVLGVIWSFLNPLVMMLVYFFVFSTIFRSNTPNFAVYLMTGVVMYNYCSDATTLGMQAIVGNAGLITKVYLPKYIYPLSKTISSSINLVISTVALFVVMTFTGAPVLESLMRLPILIFLEILLLMFCSGLGMLLSCCLVFFRDIQFLWSVFLTIWNFVTPIFYTESIIPERFLGIYHLNPLYHFVTAARSITLQGRAPMPAELLWCTVAAVASLGIGAWVFRRHQDRFVLYL